MRTGFSLRILVKLSKSGGYGLARSPKSISLLDIYSAVNPLDAFAIHRYPKTKKCVVSCNLKEAMSDVSVGTQEAVRRELRQTTLADVVGAGNAIPYEVCRRAPRSQLAPADALKSIA
jgi:DNA-binding IscR family transcriptional regulator